MPETAPDNARIGRFCVSGNLKPVKRHGRTPKKTPRRNFGYFRRRFTPKKQPAHCRAVPFGLLFYFEIT